VQVKTKPAVKVMVSPSVAPPPVRSAVTVQRACADDHSILVTRCPKRMWRSIPPSEAVSRT
jgi:hypothetical protein